jgi:hypothetical protein
MRVRRRKVGSWVMCVHEGDVCADVKARGRHASKDAPSRSRYRKRPDCPHLSEGLLNSSRAKIGSFRELTFPNSDDGPSGTPQFARNSTIPQLILRNLLQPHLPVRGWGEIPAARMSMPKTPIYKHNDFLGFPHKVRVTGE